MLNDVTAPSPLGAPVRDLVAEAHHRIANSLSAVAGLIQQQMSSLRETEAPVPAAEVRRLLGEMRGRVEAVSRLHRALSNVTEGPLDLGPYLQQIASELVATLAPPDSVTLHFTCELNCHIPPERVLYIGLIAVEIITNSLKYAHPAGVHGVVSIRCWRTPAEVMIEIADDGVGLPDGYDPAESGGSGLRIIHSLAHQIGGTVTNESNALGLVSLLKIPSAKA